MTKYLIGIFLFVTAAFAAYYFISASPSFLEESKAPETIKIGFVGPISGDSASYGISIKNSVDLAVKDSRTQGKKIEIVYEDSKCNEENAKNSILKLINTDKINVVIGGVCSGETLAMAEIAEKNQIILFSPSAAGTDISTAGTFVFRNNPSDAYGGYELASLLGKNYKNVAVISESTSYTQILRNNFIEKLSELGGQVVVDETFPPDSKDFRPILSKVKNSKAEALLINPQIEQMGGLLVKEARGLGIKLPIYAHIIPAAPKFLEVTGKTSEGIIFTDLPDLDHNNARITAFLEDYKKTFGNITGVEFYMGAAYDAVNILIQAIEKVGNDTVKIRDYLYNLPEYNGLIGKYSFDLNGDTVGIDLVLKQIKNGKIDYYPSKEEPKKL